MPIADCRSADHRRDCDHRGLTLRPLAEGDAEAIQALLVESADYIDRLTGRPPTSEAGAAVLTSTPPETSADSKHVIGAFDGHMLLGIVDVIRSWPTPNTSHIGLLLVSPEARGQGVGRLLHDHVVELSSSWADITRLRVGIVTANAEHATGFWHALGYRPRGETAPHTTGAVSSITVYWERPLAAPASAESTIRAAHPPGLHHLELWTHDLAATEPSFHWLLTTLGWSLERIDGWPLGRIWRHSSQTYLVLEQSDDVRGAQHDRLAPGLNHLALTAAHRRALDRLRSEAVQHGWRELFADRYPHAGGQDHTAWYAVNAAGFEVEVVAQAR